MPLQRGQIIIARPGFHLLAHGGHVRLGTGPKENRTRPAIDPLFRSVAATYGSRAVGVVLSGWLNDGTSGLYAIKQCGGLSVVQAPEDAVAPDMPRSAIANVAIDHTVPLRNVASLLNRLTREQAGPEQPVPPEVQVEVDIAARGGQSIAETAALGKPSVIACPDCGGSLTEVRNRDVLRFRCHVGHAFTAEALIADQDEAIERALWSAVKTMEERAAMWQRLADRNAAKGNQRVAITMREHAANSKVESNLIRGLLNAQPQKPHSERRQRIGNTA